MDNINDIIMDMLDRWEWMTTAIATYIVKNNIDVNTIPEFA